MEDDDLAAGSSHRKAKHVTLAHPGSHLQLHCLQELTCAHTQKLPAAFAETDPQACEGAPEGCLHNMKGKRATHVTTQQAVLHRYLLIVMRRGRSKISEEVPSSCNKIYSQGIAGLLVQSILFLLWQRRSDRGRFPFGRRCL